MHGGDSMFHKHFQNGFANSSTYAAYRTGRSFRSPGTAAVLWCLAALIIIFPLLRFRRTSVKIALLNAEDVVSAQLNSEISGIIEAADSSGNRYVSFEKNQAGEITAVSCDMIKIEALSSALRERLQNLADKGPLELEIPAGNFTGIKSLAGRGPGISVHIRFLNSPDVEFSNRFLPLNECRTRQKLSLDIKAGIAVSMPWAEAEKQLDSQLLIADNLIAVMQPSSAEISQG